MRLKNESRQLLDPVRPGEQWFCYWKTSAALWETRILEFAQDEIIFIPLYWGFHAEADGQWDFGDFQAEKDLSRLIHVLTQHGRKFCWLLPLTPAPFLPNGGVPISAARTLSVSSKGIHYAALDQDESLHKMYSFFEPKVFQQYASFVQAFGQLLSHSKTKSVIWGAEFYYLEEQNAASFLNDSSIAFDQGFSRYLKKNYPQGLELNERSEEWELKKSFFLEVENLFRTLAADSLSPFWKGIQKITIFGASPKETIERALSSGKSQTRYFKDLFDSYVSQRWFSTCLLSPVEKKDLLSMCLSEHFSKEEIEHRFHYLIEPSQIGSDFRPFVLLDIFDFHHPNVFEKNGLKSFLGGQYRWMFYVHSSIEFTSEWLNSSQDRVKFFHAVEMDRTSFAQMLKLFLMGQKVIFDRTGLSEDLDKRLQVFLMENNLKVQSINFLTSVTLCELGEGKLLTFEGQPLQQSDGQKQFWINIFKFLNIHHPEVQMENDIFGLWRIRATSPHELNYLDVRRVNFYNPTSYKKFVTVHTQKKFAFLKVIDPLNANVKTTTEGVQVELMPNGKLALDFGYYEERS
jgi:hypothetical protein